MDYLLVCLGLVGLFLGGEALVRGSVGLARRMGIAPLVTGLVIVGFGTSMPELLVSVDAALRAVPDISVGNIVGSNIANILLIMGLTALVFPIRVPAGSVRRDAAVMMAASALMVPVFAVGAIGRWTGIGLLAALAGYLVWVCLQSGDDAEDARDADPGAQGLGAALLWAVGGLVALLFGARFLVDGSVAIARGHGVSEAFIGLTIVAVGTSLPELATSLVAALRRQPDIAIGNIIGSNIFNILGIFGVTAVIAPIPVTGRFMQFDLPVMLAAALALAAAIWMRWGMGRAAGLAALTAYAAYVWAAQG